jgi:hypothetical protein
MECHFLTQSNKFVCYHPSPKHMQGEEVCKKRELSNDGILLKSDLNMRKITPL